MNTNETSEEFLQLLTGLNKFNRSLKEIIFNLDAYYLGILAMQRAN